MGNDLRGMTTSVLDALATKVILSGLHFSFDED